jgi:enamine deaminase RidA (YjgF/YER057c/UK114 family)
MSIEAKLKELGVTIPAIAKPAASYVPYTIINDIVYVSGQLPSENGELKYKGTLGKDVSIEDGQKAARICAINLIAALKDALGGDLEKLKSVIQLQVLVASTPDFTSQHLVANGASDFFAQVFGDKGAHTRAAYGITSIPLGASVEIMASFHIEK